MNTTRSPRKPLPEAADMPSSGTVTALVPSPRKPGVYAVRVDGKTVGSADGLQLHEQGIDLDAAWTPDLAERLCRLISHDKAKDFALRSLSTKMSTRYLLEGKLNQRGHDADTVKAVLDRCEELGVLDDRIAAEGIVRRALGSRPAGKRLLESKLTAAGVARSVAAEVITAALGERDQSADALRAAERYLSSKKPPADAEQRYKLRTKLYASLARRGFSPDEIRSASDAALPPA